ncbi:MAG: bifunctional adenosylcobinamide kinase/adenosylcobinamide-phosphate guanylyltransferase [Dehalococcoidales bacterium]|jgi:adenosylcobinamide kinase/adenosylcobinamide-phosphate guanylyltransferase|nr:bifunctional adenosylcobinamide kinase/adenosylcobinamide-phosphate guanylyltransferase [Dehalococcoidales bacterium]
MKKTILLLGGARSGKSRLAQEMAQRMSARVLYVATATAGDADMQQRIIRHRRERPASWQTLEATCNLGQAISDCFSDCDVVLIDCITLLVNNIFCRHDEKQFAEIDETILDNEVQQEITELINCIKRTGVSFIIVSNETGLGLVPENRMGRLYRDCLGRANQRLAQIADEVYFLIAGIPVRIKPNGDFLAFPANPNP